ncbi:MAG TPA: hypothetical protein VFH83_14180 [Spirochaetia bacterium]|nr:hypothetical protein [Spirochaetia bacterium]
MTRKERNPIIDLPVKVLFTTDGAEWFIRNHQKPHRVRMADRRQGYGISLNNFSAASLQKMFTIDYVSAVEIARTDFSEKGGEIVDLTKLITYRVLYRAFELETYRMFLASPLIQNWNRAHPSKTIDERSAIHNGQLRALVQSCSPELPLVSEDIQKAVLRDIEEDPKLGPEEKLVLYHLCERYVDSMRDLMRCVLSRSRGQREYHRLVFDICALLRNYLERSKIAEYLALIIMELIAYTETVHSLEIARRLFPRTQPTTEMLRNPSLRNAISRDMNEQRDYLYLTYHVSNEASSLGTENRLKVVLFNGVREYQKMKSQIETKLGLDLEEKGLQDLYRRLPKQDTDSELGLYYLSFLESECSKCGVHLDSHVNESLTSDLTVITLNLQF